MRSRIVKRLFHFTLIQFSLLFLAPSSFGQDGIVNLSFSATEANGNVLLDWTMDQGQTCNGTTITRSTDSLNFKAIGDIQGVCGSTSESVSYSFTDKFPIPNQTNYYRLILGNLGPSQVVKVEIVDIGETGFQVRPNPMTTQGRIYFQNDLSENYVLSVFSVDGTLVYEQSTRSDFFELNANSLEAGLFVFSIETDSGQKNLTGKFLVVH